MNNWGSLPMESAPGSTPPPSPPSTARSDLLTAWPRSAQWAVAFLLGVTTTLLGWHVCSSLRWSTRPTELSRENLLGYQVDLNEADAAELMQLPGVGPNLAQRILEYREASGPFRSVNEMTKVKGIGPATLARLRSLVCVRGVTEEEEDLLLGPKRRISLADQRSMSGSGESAARKVSRGKESGLTERIDLNGASAAELQRLPGIGPRLSERIIDERAKRAFQSVDDLRRVSGIGVKTLEKLRPFVCIRGKAERRATTVVQRSQEEAQDLAEEK